MTTTKVFVGNLSFKTTEEHLAQEFGVAGKVVSANIITRGPRSLGYGFVELENESAAKKAVELLDKKEIDGRAINVEIAKPRSEEEKSEDQPREGGRGRGGFRARGRGGFRARGRGSRGGFRGSPRGAFRGTRGTFRGRGRGRGRGFGNMGEERPRTERVSSDTTLFVANLPYDLEDSKFAEKIKEFVPKFTKAYIVTKNNGRSKGFGFVEFDDAENQKKALEALDGKEIEGRVISVKIALTEAKDENGQDN